MLPTTDRPRQVLILGPPRSGTTLLAGMLACSPAISVLNEELTGAVRRAIGPKIAAVKLCVPIQATLRKDRSLRRRVERRLRTVVGLPLTDWAIEDYVGWDETALVLIVRRAEGVVSSMMRRGGLSARAASARFEEALEVLHRTVEEYSDQSIVVQFEDLVVDPEKELSRIASFMKIPMDPSMLEGHRYAYAQAGKIDASAVERTILPEVQLTARAMALYRELTNDTRAGMNLVPWIPLAARDRKTVSLKSSTS